MRINAFLSRAGVASRRKADELIKAGRVMVNGKQAQLNTQVLESDSVQVDKTVVSAQAKRYILLNKPIGYLTTLADPEGRPIITDLIDVKEKLKPVGRLDFNTSGLLVLTNDGQLAQKLSHPSQKISKTYEIIVNEVITAEILNKLSNGIQLEDGITAPARASQISGNKIELIIHEGRNRQVRRMVQAVGLRLLRLKRTNYGPLNLEGLAAGKWRDLTDAELDALNKA